MQNLIKAIIQPPIFQKGATPLSASATKSSTSAVLELVSMSIFDRLIEKTRVVMMVYFKTNFEGYHLKIKLLKKSNNFYFPAKCNDWGRSIKIHDKMVKLVHNAKKNRYIRTHFSFFLATPYLLSYPLQSFGGKFKIVNFYKQLDF